MTQPALTPASAYPDPATAPALHWGILAPGGIAQRFAREIPAFTASTIAAVGSRSAERAAAFAAEFAIPRSYGSYAELVADPDLDAIYIASPHSEHRDHALLALNAGKPVLVEKAFTRNAAEAREVFDVAASRDLFAGEAMWSRFLPGYRAVVDAVTQGAIGQVRSITAQHGQMLVGANPRLWRPDLAGGAMLDLTVYPISFAHALLGAPAAITAIGHLTDAGVDAAETVVMSYPDHAVAVAQASLETALENLAIVAGTLGRIVLDRTFYGSTTAHLYLHDGSEAHLPPQHEGGFQFQAAAAARAIAAGQRSFDLLTWQDTIEVMEIMDEARRQLGAVLPGE